MAGSVWSGVQPNGGVRVCVVVRGVWCVWCVCVCGKVCVVVCSVCGSKVQGGKSEKAKKKSSNSCFLNCLKQRLVQYLPLPAPRLSCSFSLFFAFCSSVTSPSHAYITIILRRSSSSSWQAAAGRCRRRQQRGKMIYEIIEIDRER